MKLHCWYKPKIPTTSPSLHRPVHWSNSTNCHIRSAICILVNSSFVTSFVGYASILPRRLDGCIGVLNNYERSIRSHDATYLDNCPIMDRWSVCHPCVFAYTALEARFKPLNANGGMKRLNSSLPHLGHKIQSMPCDNSASEHRGRAHTGVGSAPRWLC